jgi:hypothetical protein
VVLRHCVALLGGEAVPLHRFGSVADHAIFQGRNLKLKANE